MLDIIFVYLVNPVKEVMAELLPIFIAPIKILFEIFIRYIEVEGWYVVICSHSSCHFTSGSHTKSLVLYAK